MDNDFSGKADLERLFNPDDISNWMKYPSEEFIGIIVNELRRECQTIQVWTQMINEDKNIASIIFAESRASQCTNSKCKGCNGYCLNVYNDYYTVA